MASLSLSPISIYLFLNTEFQNINQSSGGLAPGTATYVTMPGAGGAVSIQQSQPPQQQQQQQQAVTTCIPLSASVQGGVPVSVSVSGGPQSVTVLAPAGGAGGAGPQVIHSHFVPQTQLQQHRVSVTPTTVVAAPAAVAPSVSTAASVASVSAASAQSAGQPATAAAAAANANKQVEPRQLADLAKQLDPTLLLDDEVSDLLLELADDFVDAVAHQACQLAKHRGSSVLEAKDVALVVERHYGIEVPGFAAEIGPGGSGGALRAPRKQLTTEAHRQRLMLIKKAMKKH